MAIHGHAFPGRPLVDILRAQHATVLLVGMSNDDKTMMIVVYSDARESFAHALGVLESEFSHILQQHCKKNARPLSVASLSSTKNKTQWTRCMAQLKPVIAALTLSLDALSTCPEETSILPSVAAESSLAAQTADCDATITNEINTNERVVSTACHTNKTSDIEFAANDEVVSDVRIVEVPLEDPVGEVDSKLIQGAIVPNRSLSL